MTSTLLTPSTNATPVEKAVASGIADGFEPQTFLWMFFHRPNGSVRFWYAWTTGGTTLGNSIDVIARMKSLDGADWLHYGDRHAVLSTRGAIRIEAYPLRPILADIHNGERAPADRRAAMDHLVKTAAEDLGRPLDPSRSTWLGYGPNRTSEAMR
ncbi:hypothetical protein J7E97_07925 [Streptomyces sp. ISL-66]|uniref:hypothetical protein n=1 Tax=Streptomyces sp. ISL-66 TaxID=2819186 RepID=UPI001BEC1E07|nr:hypothetical protein [Streptomyces sp. ISL-66]MBT2467801.1 hypothetical protein [Streptomyces sp. ISL-66]